jgi:hypothetical protein
MALFKTDYEEGRLQPTPAGHPQLAIPRANSPFYWFKLFLDIFVYKSVAIEGHRITIWSHECSSLLR